MNLQNRLPMQLDSYAIKNFFHLPQFHRPNMQTADWNNTFNEITSSQEERLRLKKISNQSSEGGVILI